jgi:hypothetical protein
MCRSLHRQSGDDLHDSEELLAACARAVQATMSRRPSCAGDIPGFEIRRASVDDVSASSAGRCCALLLCAHGRVSGWLQLLWMMDMTRREGWNKCARDMLAIHTVDREHSFVGTLEGHRVASVCVQPLFGYM